MSANSIDVASRLLNRSAEILRRWEERVRAEIPASRTQSSPVLRDNFSQLLAEVARALCPTDQHPRMTAGLTPAEDHGSRRAMLAEYQIAEVFQEYRLLRKVILEVLDVPSPLSPTEREVIHDAMDQAVQEAVSQFAQVIQEVERALGDKARRTADELRIALARERHITEVLQRPLLLKIPEDVVQGLSLATIYEPARPEAEVGGDFYDVVPLVDGRVALVLGDTCGKGLVAAAHNTHIKDVLRAFLRESPPAPGPVLMRLNNVACDVFDADEDAGSRFVVLALLIVEPATGAASYSSAGAEPLLVIRSAGEAAVVERPGLPLGITRGTHYQDTKLCLAAGDTAVLVTDGITEARDGRELLGYPGMVQLAMSALKAPSLREASEAILSGAREFAHGKLSDDACLILARRK